MRSRARACFVMGLWPLPHSPQGRSSRAASASQRAPEKTLLSSQSDPPWISLRSASSWALMESSSSAGPESSFAASRARSGHRPPTVSAIERRVRQLSCARSWSSLGTAGSRSARPGPLSAAHRAHFLRSSSNPCVRSSRSLFTLSEGSFRSIRISIDRSASVCCSLPISAITTAAKTA